jgi:hypothetical protein
MNGEVIVPWIYNFRFLYMMKNTSKLNVLLPRIQKWALESSFLSSSKEEDT